MAKLEWIPSWIKEWDSTKSQGQEFRDAFEHARIEARGYLKKLTESSALDASEYYDYIGATTREFKGSGLSTVFAAICLLSKYYSDPEQAIIAAVNALGSDTDTIAAFTGAYFGAHYGLEVVPLRWQESLQDHTYLMQIAQRLHRIARGNDRHARSYLVASAWGQIESLLSVYSWETRLFELFLERPEENELVVHPSLGVGKVIKEEVRPLVTRKDYQVHLVRVAFDCGQTCTFHARVAIKTGIVSESEELSSELERNPDLVKELRILA
ncbi:MAG TPA: ADP-ribosylglycohydrolase family protein [Ktedonobacteraceae bacterium]|nr:ADP-ribosylglycohydrolase family protein [Ktedonobacteraceae bacterium]HEU5381989.1 ADP-ribosylglycohydrolase family protein [Ktedonobacteraceae bacterium]